MLLAAVALSAGGDGTEGFLPREDLGVAALQAAVPEADGRGVLVAVLDTGVDLLHPALARCPDGSSKIVDFLDATDAGEVATTTTAAVDGGAAMGLTGRRLLLGEGAPATVRLGVLRAGEIYPDGLLRRLREERARERDRAQRLAAERAPDGVAPPPPPDPGDPVHDLVLYERDGAWRVRLDTDADGDLAEEREVREYPVAQEVVTIGGEARLGLGVRVLRGGAAVSLLFDGGGHGTHVAGIIAGYAGPDSPLNGLAPAAKILAVKIGNGRHGGATTHLAILRGLDWAGRAGARVVNISFGGASLYADGREVVARFLDDAVAKYGYAACVSAGNAGPAHGTVGAPATARRALVFGAYAPASTQRSNYGVIAPRGGSLFGFSSRGPLPGGGAGVLFLAPGAAVSMGPEWTLVSGLNMNGTSMAAPQGSGAVAALLSAAAKEGLAPTPARLRAALLRTARPEPGLAFVEQGYGFPDVHAALASLRETAAAPEPVGWRVERDGPGGGVLVRALGADPIPAEVRLVPDFPAEAPAEQRARFARLVRLEPEAAWIQAASPLHVAAKGATARILVRPEGLAPGLESSFVRVLDAATGAEEARIPVTAVRPHAAPRCGEWVREEMRLSSGQARSLFVLVPSGATTVRVESRESDPRGDTRIALRAPGFRVEDEDAAASPQTRAAVRHHAVLAGTVLEVAAYRHFSAERPGESAVEVSLCFKGLAADAAAVAVPAGRFGTHVNVVAGGAVDGRFVGESEWTEEPLRVTWTTRPDPDAPVLLADETLTLHTGVAAFTVPADRGEVRIDLKAEGAFDDYLDDAVLEVRDGNGKVHARGFLWRGPFFFFAPRRGRYEAVFRVWERGRAFLREGRIFAPALWRRAPRRDLEFRRDVWDGLLPGGPSGPGLSLADGERAAILVESPGGGERRRGAIRFVDREWDAPLLALPVVAEAAAAADPDAELKAAFLALFDAERRAALDRDEVPPSVLGRQHDLAGLARAAGLLSPAADAEVLVLQARTGRETAGEALAALLRLPQGEAAVRRGLVEAALLAGDTAQAEDRIKALDGDDGEDARRLRFLVAHAKGDHAAALTHADRYLEIGPPRPWVARGRFAALVALGRLPEARIALLRYLEDFPGREGEALGMAAALPAEGGK